MLDPRIYRTGFVAVALAAMLFAFSLNDQQGPLGSTLAPDAFNAGGAATQTMKSLAQNYPARRPGSTGDNDVAAYVYQQLNRIQGLNVSRTITSARTVDGTKDIQTITATRPGLSSGTIVIVSHRDALGSPAEADLSGTAALIELARVLAGEKLQHTVVLASTSGSAGAAGATELVRTLPGPIDAVVALGDLAGTRITEPVLVPWSNGQDVASPRLRNTLAAGLAAQASLKAGGMSLGGQLAHLALPLTTSEQGPFGALGIPAVLVSLSGDRAPAADAPVDETGARLTGVGQAVLQAVNALDAGPSVPAATPYLLYNGKVIPDWAVRLLVLALILPVLGVTIDGLARARRRGHSISRWCAWVLSGAVPFLLAAGLVLASRTLGLVTAAPPGPVGADAVPLHGSGIALLLLSALLIVAGFFIARRLIIAWVGAQRKLEGSAREGAGIALLLVMCLVTIAIWIKNPFAAALVIPALHGWIWIADPDVRLRPAISAALILIGLAPPILLVYYYAHTLGLTPVGVLWNGALMIAGGHIAVITVIEWSVLLGCTASVVLLAARALREPAPEQMPITVRGPIGYAGPGSLGGTKSALRR